MNDKNNQFINQSQAANAHMWNRRKEQERILKIANAKSFQDRMQDFDLILKNIVIPISTILSVITEGLFLFIFFFGITQSKTLALIITAILVFLIEMIKIVGGLRVVRSMCMGWIRDGMHYSAYMVGLMFFTLLAFGSSAYLSIEGTPITAEYFTRSNKNEMSFINKDSINQAYDEKLSYYQEQQRKAMNTTWKGSVTSSAMTLSRQIQKEVEKLEADRRATLLLAETKNEKQHTLFENKIITTKSWARSFGGINEVLMLVMLVLRGIYEWAVSIELPESSYQSYTAQTNPAIGFHQQIIPSTNQRRPIGFNPLAHPSEQYPEQPPDIQSPTCDTIVPQTNNAIIEIDVYQTKNFAKTYYKRSITSKGEKARQDNYNRYLELKEKLNKVGIAVEEISQGLKGPDLIFHEIGKED